MKKKLYKSTTNKKIAGVCGGIAEYFGIDATWIRLAFCFIALFAGVGILPYLVFAIVLPKDTSIESPSPVASEEIPKAEDAVITKKCPMCDAEVATDAEFCSICGYKF